MQLQANIHAILKDNWGYDKFRPLQEDIIKTILSGNDVLALLPTGGGKSICFQVPALAKNGICLVVSPLIALMKDQVYNLNKRGIPALALHTGMHYKEVERTLENALHGNFKFLYVSPERLKTKLFLAYLPDMDISMVAVDEAHCISQWGYDFRPPYLEIAKLREHLPNVNIIALTASATPQVQDDICEKLEFGKNARRFMQSFERPNLSYSVYGHINKEVKLLQVLTNVQGTAIVYCKTRRQTMKVAQLLQQQGVQADFYHAGLSTEEKTAKQEAWIDNKTRCIVCTNAFGMGIDKPDVRVVVHFDVPDGLENYYQEAGRAGRDGKRAYAVLLTAPSELEKLKADIATRFPAYEELKKIYLSLFNHLQVAAGSGEGMSFDFDIALFAQNFKLNLLQVGYALKFFEQQGLLLMSEALKRPATVEFTATKNDLKDLELHNPTLNEISQALLRSYPGIFDFKSPIYEMRLAKMLNKPTESIIAGLREMNAFGLIDYTPASDKPQLYLVENRMYVEAFWIDMKKWRALQQNALDRLQAMQMFVDEKLICRSKLIAGYFGDGIKECTICDNCIECQKAKLTTSQIMDISNKLLGALNEEGEEIGTFLKKIQGVHLVDVWRVLNMLESDGFVERKLNLIKRKK